MHSVFASGSLKNMQAKSTAPVGELPLPVDTLGE